MPRLKNALGVVVDVSDETAALLSGFEPADKSDAKPDVKVSAAKTADPPKK